MIWGVWKVEEERGREWRKKKIKWPVNFLMSVALIVRGLSDGRRGDKHLRQAAEGCPAAPRAGRRLGIEEGRPASMSEVSGAQRGAEFMGFVSVIIGR
jgi:hypothetical protein